MRSPTSPEGVVSQGGGLTGMGPVEVVSKRGIIYFTLTESDG